MADALDIPGNRGLTFFSRTGEEVLIEELPEYREFFENLSPYSDPVSILLQCEEHDEAEGLPPGTSLELYRLHLKSTK